MLEVKMTNDFGLENGINVLVYGQAGIGKTVLCTTAPKPFIISAESGLLSIARMQNIPYVTIRCKADLWEAYQMLTLDQNLIENVQTICIDSLSEISEIVLAEAKKNNKDGRQAYGELYDSTTAIVRLFRDIPKMDKYYSSQMTKIQTESGALIYGPLLPGSKLGESIPFKLDEIFAMRYDQAEGEELKRVLQTAPSMAYTAKDRSGQLDFLEEPNLTTIFNKIKGGKNA